MGTGPPYGYFKGGFILNRINYNLYQKCYRKWGIGPQKQMVIEEMAELTKELCKSDRKGLLDTWPGIVAELVDVEIMIEQLKVILSDHVLEYDHYYRDERIRKLTRLEEMVKGG